MGHIFKKRVKRVIPLGATFSERKGVEYAQWKGRDGKKKQCEVVTQADGSKRVLVDSGTYMCRYRDGSGVIREASTKCRGMDSARAVLGELERRAEKVRSGIITPQEDAIADWQSLPLREHIEDYRRYMVGRGLSAVYMDKQIMYLRIITEDCAYLRLSDMERSSFERFLARKRNLGRAPKTLNGFRGTALSFGNWLVQESRLNSNPFLGIRRFNEQVERRHVRRSFTEKELLQLFDATQERPLHDALNKNRGKGPAVINEVTQSRLKALGRERALIYKTLVLTGLRVGELRSITLCNVLFSDTSYIDLPAKDDKARRGAQIPLRPDLAQALKAHLIERLETTQREALRNGAPIPVRLDPTSHLFTVPRAFYKIMNRDLAFAGINKRDDRDRVLDVHSLRMTFGTHLSKAGVPLRTAQAAMRHSDPRLTANIYTDPQLLDVRGGINALPDLPFGDTSYREAVAQGYKGHLELPPKLPPIAGKTCLSGSFPVKVSEKFLENNLAGEQKNSPCLQGHSSGDNTCRKNKMVELKGIEPSTSALRTQHSPN